MAKFYLKSSFSQVEQLKKTEQEAEVQLFGVLYANDARLGFNFYPLASTSLDFLYAIQDFLPHIAFAFEFGEGLAGQLFTHFEMPRDMNTAELYAYRA
jgi:hypothetical protein